MNITTNLASLFYSLTGKNEHKKFLYICLFLFVFLNLNSQTEYPTEKKILRVSYDNITISISPLIIPNLGIGFGTNKKLTNHHITETFIKLNICETFNVYRQYGISFRMNQFFSINRKAGLFWIMNAGLDYLQYEPFCIDPGGSNCDGDKIIYSGIVPNIATGLGYSVKIGKRTFLRLEWDIGLKWIISNIYLSIVW